MFCISQYLQLLKSPAFHVKKVRTLLTAITLRTLHMLRLEEFERRSVVKSIISADIREKYVRVRFLKTHAWVAISSTTLCAIIQSRPKIMTALMGMGITKHFALV